VQLFGSRLLVERGDIVDVVIVPLDGVLDRHGARRDSLGNDRHCHPMSGSAQDATEETEAESGAPGPASSRTEWRKQMKMCVARVRFRDTASTWADDRGRGGCHTERPPAPFDSYPRQARIGSKASFKLFSQWPERRRQRTFPAAVERVFVTRSGNSRSKPASTAIGWKAVFRTRLSCGFQNIPFGLADVFGRTRKHVPVLNDLARIIEPCPHNRD
jgi:hypothetical protein